MKISMNVIRTTMAYAFNNFAQHQEDMLQPNEFGEVVVSLEDVRDNKIFLDELRAQVGLLICCYEPGDDDFIDLSDKLSLVEVMDDEI